MIFHCCTYFLCSELELKPEGKLSVTVVKATSLKNKELIGKSDPYVTLYVRPMFKVKTKVIDDNLNPEWNETFELIVEDKETQSVIFEVILCCPSPQPLKMRLHCISRENNGSFSTKSVYNMYFADATRCSLADAIWHNKAPLKCNTIKIFTS